MKTVMNLFKNIIGLSLMALGTVFVFAAGMVYYFCEYVAFD